MLKEFILCGPLQVQLTIEGFYLVQVIHLVADLAGLVNRVFIDRMNYLNQIKAFYRQQNLEWATEDKFFQEYKTRLKTALKKKRMKFEAIF